MTEVLVLRALGLGDLLASVAALRGLRRAWPDARLVLAAPAALGEWLASLGVVDDVVDRSGLDDGPLAGEHGAPPDVAVNLHGRGPASHRVVMSAGARAVIGFACPEMGFDEGPDWREEEHEVDRWLRLTAWAGGPASVEDLRLQSPGERAGHVVVHPGAASGSRRWPVDRWAAVAAALVADGRRVVVTGTAGEADLCAHLAAAAGGIENCCGRLDLPVLGRLIGTASLLLSGDTGVAHVATAFATPSVTLFGPVSPELWGPRIDAPLHRVLWPADGSELRPGDAHGTTPDPRLLAIRASEVLDAARQLLEAR